MKNRPDYYRILHVQPDAPVAIIKASYRTLMTKLDMHPDRGGEHERAAMINEAYAILSDQIKRNRYDESLLKLEGKLSNEKRTYEAKSAQKECRNSGYGNPDWQCEYRNQRRSTEPRCVFCRKPHPYGDLVPLEAHCMQCRSPLAYALNIKRIHSGRRKLVRVDVYQGLDLFTQWPQKVPIRVSLKDFSPDGLQFYCDRPIELGIAIKISNTILEAIAQVVYCRKAESVSSNFVVGARFITLYCHSVCGTFISTTT